MDAIAMGCAAVFLARNFGIGTRWTLRIAGIALAFCVLFRGVARSMGLLKTGLDVTVLAVGIVLILVTIREDSGTTREGSGRGVWKPLAWFGRNSYEIYLTHMFVVTIGATIYNNMGKPVNYGPIWFVVNVALAGLLGATVARWYSVPWNRRLTRQKRATMDECVSLSA
jgi:peptidoglycan/LPS O-acetylase OafA/YrhL